MPTPPFPYDQPPSPPSGHILRALFDQLLLPVLCRPVTALEMRETDGDLSIWLPEIPLMIVSHEIPSPARHDLRVEVARATAIDMLAIDCTRPGPIECEVDLFSPSWVQHRTIDRILLWLSPLGQPYLVPLFPRNGMPGLAQSMGFSPDGLTILGDPFKDRATWSAGLRRASATMAAAMAAIVAGEARRATTEETS